MKNVKKLISVLLVAFMLLSVMPLSLLNASAETVTMSVFNSKLNDFKNKYPNNSTYVDDPSGTGGYQCFGFANELAKYIFGSYPTSSMSAYTVNSGWKRTYGESVVDSLCVGDIVRYQYHSIFITKIDGDTITYCQANVPSGTNRVTYDNTISKSNLKAKVKKQLTHSDATTVGWVAHFEASQTNKVTPVLTVDYHANGATINSQITGYKYKVTDDAGLNLRSDAGTGNSVLVSLPKNTTFTVNEGDTKTANGYTWGKTTYNGKTGWVVISDYVSKTATLRNTDFYLSSSMVYRTSSGSLVSHEIEYGTSPESGLYNYTTFKLEREGYSFVGWSLSADGSTTIFDQDDEVLKAEDICPDLKNGNKSVVLYAIWEEDAPATYTVSYNANGGNGAPANQTKIHGVNLRLSSIVPSRTGYNFLGWSTSSTATSATYSADAIFSENSNTTLYAVWAKCNHNYNNVNDYKCSDCGYTVTKATLRKTGDTWYYYNNGVLDNSNTLVKHTDGKWYHVKGGKVVRDTTLVKYNGSWFYVKNGVKNDSNTLVYYNGQWRHVKGGKYVTDTTLVYYNGSWFYVKDGVKNTENTLIYYNGQWRHVKGGKYVTDTTLVYYNGSWFYVKDGVKNTENTLIYYNGKWRHVKDGKWVKDTAIVKYNGSWFYIKDGIKSNHTGKVKIDGITYTLNNGKVV